MRSGKVVCIIGALAFFLLVGIVGAVERGAALANLWWAVPCVLVIWACIRIGERSYNNDKK